MGESTNLWWRSRWLDAIYDSDLTPSQRFVATVYADFANSGRTSWVPISQLMHRTGYSNKGVILARNALVEKGWIIQVSKPTRHKAATFALVIPEGQLSTGVAEGHISGVNSVHASDDPGVNSVHTQGCTQFTSRGELSSQKKSSRNPLSILSPGQRAFQKLTACDEQDERLDDVEAILKDRDIKNPAAWLTRVHQRGDLQKLLDEQRSNRPGSAPEGWGDLTGPAPDEVPRGNGYGGPTGSAWGIPYKEPRDCDNPDCVAGWITTDNPDGHPNTRRCPTCKPLAS